MIYAIDIELFDDREYVEIHMMNSMKFIRFFFSLLIIDKKISMKINFMTVFKWSRILFNRKFDASFAY